MDAISTGPGKVTPLRPAARELTEQDQADEQLALAVARAQTGDKAAFAQIYRSQHRRVYALCVRLLGDRQLAEELTQDAFIKAWQQLHSFRGEAKFSTWLHRVTANAVISYQRKHSPWLRWLKKGSGDDEIPESPMHESPGEARDLEAAIAKLPVRARQVFVLMDIEGYSHDETAAMLGIAEGTSKAQLFRARELLRAMLA
ncbi:MAG TPA: sigma-70 family RNA polymerase sigma factor [Permianibacter sp.]|nr:sigma-70 family RNA polymerase sigma factor [Permianibacter sp.]